MLFVLPDGDGVTGSCSDVPAAVQSGWILERPTRAGDDPTGRPQELRHITTGWTETKGLLDSLCRCLLCADLSCVSGWDLTIRNP